MRGIVRRLMPERAIIALIAVVVVGVEVAWIGMLAYGAWYVLTR